MVRVNENTKELAFKIVYYGPACSGKTKNLEFLNTQLRLSVKEDLISLKTGTERTLFFDYLQIRMGSIHGAKVRFLIYSVPGQVFYNDARRSVLKGVDGLVFVADSDSNRLQENRDCYENMIGNLQREGNGPQIPLVFQYNKRDLTNAASSDVLNETLNKRKKIFIEAIAKEGIGVVETFREITKVILLGVSRGTP